MAREIDRHIERNLEGVRVGAGEGRSHAIPANSRNMFSCRLIHLHFFLLCLISGRYKDVAETDYITFKRAIENEIVENRITSERALKRLFRDYLKHNDPQYKPVLRKVIADLKVEWDVA